MTVYETKLFKIHFKILYIFIIICLLLMTNINSAKAQVKIPKVSVHLENTKIDKNLREPVFRIKNQSDQKIRVKKVVVERQIDGEWIELERKKNASVKRNISIEPGKKVYDSILLSDTYKINRNELISGKYHIKVVYKTQGKYYYQSKEFNILETGNTEEVTGTVDKNIACTSPTKNEVITKGKEIVYLKATHILLNSDFCIDKHGNVSAVVFSENDYETAIKTKLKIKIQRKHGKKWVTYKKYKVVKKSNIAYANKKFRLRKSGTYRMKVEITVYHKKQKKQTKVYVSGKRRFKRRK